MFLPMQRRIQRTLLDLENFAGDLSVPFRDSPAVVRFEFESLENQQVQCALRKVDARQDVRSWLYWAMLLVFSVEVQRQIGERQREPRSKSGLPTYRA